MKGNIYISGLIGTFNGEKGIELIDVISQVKKQPEADGFNVYIDSDGGVVDTGFDIYNYLKSLNKPITTIGSGIVASIATVIFMAGENRMVRENTPFMVHLPWGGTTGTSDEIEQYANDLRAIEKKMTGFYTKALGLEEEAILPLLREETWLTADQLSTLGFTTLQPIVAAAKAVFNPNTDKMSNLTEKDRTWMEGLFDKVLGKSKTPIVNKLVQDASGTELNFEGLADDATVEVGATATVDGSAAEGEYTMPDETVYVFSAGKLTEIKPAEEDAELDAANARIVELEAELETERTARASAETTVAEIRKDVVALKKQVMSKFDASGKKPVASNKKDNDTDPKDRTAGMREYLKNKRGN